MTSTTPYQKGVVHAAARLFLNSYSRLVKAAFAVQKKKLKIQRKGDNEKVGSKRVRKREEARERERERE